MQELQERGYLHVNGIDLMHTHIQFPYLRASVQLAIDVSSLTTIIILNTLHSALHCRMRLTVFVL